MVPPPTAPGSYEDAIRDNLRARRSQLGLDQERVAARMQELGHTNWYRQTVGTVEKGPRKVSVSELLSLSLALETSIASLLAPDTSSPDRRVIDLNGRLLPSTSISDSAGIGRNDGAVRWDGDHAIWPSDRMIELLAGMRDRSAEARRELDKVERLPISSAAEEADVQQAVVALLLEQAEEIGLSPEQVEQIRAQTQVDAPAGSSDPLSTILAFLGPGGVDVIASTVDSAEWDPKPERNSEPVNAAQEEVQP